MRLAQIVLLCGAVFYFSGKMVVAQDYKLQLLEKEADLICSGRVESIENLEPGVSPSNQDVGMLAKVKVLHTFKGLAPGTIYFKFVVCYPSVDLDGNMEDDGVRAGGRYRFFLQKQADGKYSFIGRQTYFSVFTMGKNEADDSPCLSFEDASKAASAYIQAKTPGFQLGPGSQFYPGDDDPRHLKGAAWVMSCRPQVSKYPQGDPGHDVYVLMDGTVDPNYLNH